MITSRDFVASTAQAGALAAAPLVVLVQRCGAVPPSGRIFAAGTGSLRKSGLRALLCFGQVQFVAICDVCNRRREEVKSMLDQKYPAQHGNSRLPRGAPAPMSVEESLTLAATFRRHDHTCQAKCQDRNAAAQPRLADPGGRQPPKSVLDWNRWLVPAPWHPYRSSYVRGGWRNRLARRPSSAPRRT